MRRSSLRTRLAIIPVSVLAAGAFGFVPAASWNTNGAIIEVATQSGRPGHHYYEELSKAPEKARNRLNPLENDPDAMAAGAKLFEQHCSGCHGKTAEGGRKGPSLRVPEVQTATPGALFWVLTNGVVRRGMPVWSKLPEQQRWQIVRYLQSPVR